MLFRSPSANRALHQYQLELSRINCEISAREMEQVHGQPLGGRPHYIDSDGYEVGRVMYPELSLGDLRREKMKVEAAIARLR